MTTNTFIPSCWFWRAGLGRARGEQRERRLAAARARGVGVGAGAPGSAAISQPERSATVTRSPSSEAAPAPSVQAVLRLLGVGDRAQRTPEQARASRGHRERPALRTGPMSPKRRQRAKSRRPTGGDQRKPEGASTPTRRAARASAVGLLVAAVEVRSAACRAQLRAGALSAGADVHARSKAKSGNAGDGGLDARRLPPEPLRGQAAARHVRTLPDRSDFQERREEAGRVIRRKAAGARRAAWIVERRCRTISYRLQRTKTGSFQASDFSANFFATSSLSPSLNS